MKPLSLLFRALLLPGLFAGCLENPLYEDEYFDESESPVDYPPPPGPPEISGNAMITSATYVTRFGGTMTVWVRVSNAAGVETAYDIEAEVIVIDGSDVIGTASIYLGDLDAGQWTETSVDMPISAFPGPVTTTKLELTWWDLYDNMYENPVKGYLSVN